MKRAAIFFAGLFLIFEAPVFAADQVGPKAGPAVEARVTRMKAAGTVMEISDTVLKIERTVKGKIEGMEFTLEKPVARIAVGDKVQVSYIIKEDKNVATKVTKTVVKPTPQRPTINAKPVPAPPHAAPIAK